MAPQPPGASRAKVAAALAAAQLAHAQDDPNTPQDESAQGVPEGQEAPGPEQGPEAGMDPEMQEIQQRIVRLEDILIQNQLTTEEELSGQQPDPSVAQQAVPAGPTGAPPPQATPY